MGIKKNILCRETMDSDKSSSWWRHVRQHKNVCFVKQHNNLLLYPMKPISRYFLTQKRFLYFCPWAWGIEWIPSQSVKKMDLLYFFAGSGREQNICWRLYTYLIIKFWLIAGKFDWISYQLGSIIVSDWPLWTQSVYQIQRESFSTEMRGIVSWNGLSLVTKGASQLFTIFSIKHVPGFIMYWYVVIWSFLVDPYDTFTHVILFLSGTGINVKWLQQNRLITLCLSGKHNCVGDTRVYY